MWEKLEKYDRHVTFFWNEHEQRGYYIPVPHEKEAFLQLREAFDGFSDTLVSTSPFKELNLVSIWGVNALANTFDIFSRKVKK